MLFVAPSPARETARGYRAASATVRQRRTGRTRTSRSWPAVYNALLGAETRRHACPARWTGSTVRTFPAGLAKGGTSCERLLSPVHLRAFASSRPAAVAARRQRKRADTGGIKIGLLLDDLRQERWKRDRDLFVSRAEELHAKVEVRTGEGNPDTPAQGRQRAARCRREGARGRAERSREGGRDRRRRGGEESARSSATTG